MLNYTHRPQPIVVVPESVFDTTVSKLIEVPGDVTKQPDSYFAMYLDCKTNQISNMMFLGHVGLENLKSNTHNHVIFVENFERKSLEPFLKYGILPKIEYFKAIVQSVWNKSDILTLSCDYDTNVNLDNPLVLANEFNIITLPFSEFELYKDVSGKCVHTRELEGEIVERIVADPKLHQGLYVYDNDSGGTLRTVNILNRGVEIQVNKLFIDSMKSKAMKYIKHKPGTIFRLTAGGVFIDTGYKLANIIGSREFIVVKGKTILTDFSLLETSYNE